MYMTLKMPMAEDIVVRKIQLTFEDDTEPELFVSYQDLLGWFDRSALAMMQLSEEAAHRALRTGLTEDGLTAAMNEGAKKFLSIMYERFERIADEYT